MNDNNIQIEGNPKRASGPKRGEQQALRHGLTPLKKAVKTLGNRELDKGTMAGKALAQWRQELIGDLGGDISTQQDSHRIAGRQNEADSDSIDVWLLQQDTLIIKHKRSIIPAVTQHQVSADALSRYMGQLGLVRRTS